MRAACASVIAVLALAGAAAPAAAGIERFAILIGNDEGARDEVTLRYAGTDATRLAEVLVELGDFRPENVTVLHDATATAARRAIITVNDRIRGLSAGTDAVLLVFYSGHADASSLHLGDTELDLVELERLVRGSSADVRLLILDACRSGAMTRVKGGRRSNGFRIQLDERLAAQGAIFLTSSAAAESAQESDELGGSFFTHYLVSGLLGAADESNDGRVSLAEAYRYAYDNTLRATSRTLEGVQHATFELDLSGRGEVVLTDLNSGRRRGWLTFPDGRTYLVLAGSAGGAVVAEVGARDRRRRLRLRPGRYFVRGRGRDNLVEGVVSVSAGGERAVRDGELTEIAYARLVRKGGVIDRAHGPELGLRVHTALANADSPCPGGFAGYRLALPAVDVGARLGWCRAGYSHFALESTVDEIDLELRLGKTWDVPWLSLGPVVSAGAGLFVQRFDTRGIAPDRTSAHGHLGVGATLTRDLTAATHVVVDAVAETYFFRGAGDADQLGASFGLRTSFAIAWSL